MESLTWWTWVWANFGSWWWTGQPGMLQSMGLQRVGHNWATELNWLFHVGTELYLNNYKSFPCDKTLRIYFPSFMYNMLNSLNIFIMLYITPLVLIYNWKFVPFAHSSLLPIPASGNLKSISFSYEFVCFWSIIDL